MNLNCFFINTNLLRLRWAEFITFFRSLRVAIRCDYASFLICFRLERSIEPLLRNLQSKRGWNLWYNLRP